MTKYNETEFINDMAKLEWKQFLVGKKRMLDAYDSGKIYAQAHEVEVYQGKVAESQFRKWLAEFLPQKFGVTAGYIIPETSNLLGQVRYPHFDVIIYNKMEAPVLWTEGHPDLSESGHSRAIPAEYVYAVFEIKSSLYATSAGKAIEHLFDLESLFENDSSNCTNKTSLGKNFFSMLIFFDLLEKHSGSNVLLKHLVPKRSLRGYQGGIVLRGENLLPEKSGRISMAISDRELVDQKVQSRLPIDPNYTTSCSKGVKLADDSYLAACLNWGIDEFAIFAFDIIALLSGRYKPNGIPSSRHGLSGLVGYLP